MSVREKQSLSAPPSAGFVLVEFNAEPSAADHPLVFDAGILEEGFLGFLDKSVELFFAKELCGCLLCDALSVEIKCCLCSENNVFKLNILIKSSETKNALDIRNIIFCKKHTPIGFQTQSILDIVELDEITKRKLNKVQLKYKNKNNYYEIYKPLLIADMIYTRKVYDNKLEYDIELQAKGQNYYFEISQYFTEINYFRKKIQ